MKKKKAVEPQPDNFTKFHSIKDMALLYGISYRKMRNLIKGILPKRKTGEMLLPWEVAKVRTALETAKD